MAPETPNDGGSQATATAWDKLKAILKEPPGDPVKAREWLREYYHSQRMPKKSLSVRIPTPIPMHVLTQSSPPDAGCGTVESSGI
jgi:hypothetical protein